MKVSMLAGAVAAALSLSVSVGSAQTPLWIQFCTEGQVCTLDGVRQVRFGSGKSYSYNVAAHQLQCSAALFGDPLPGQPKVCEYRQTRAEYELKRMVSERDGRIETLQSQVGQAEQRAEELEADLNAAVREINRYERTLRRREGRDGGYGPVFRPRTE